MKVHMGKVEQKIMDIAEVEPWLRMLVYGPNKQGKTLFGASAPKPLIIDVNEKGTKTARNKYPGAKVLQCSTWSDIVEAFWYLRTHVARDTLPFESYVIDTTTAMQGACMKHVLKVAHERDENKDPKLPSKRDYGKVSELMRGQVLAFRNLPMHGIFLAQEKVFGDPEEGEPLMHGPDLSGANQRAVMGAVDMIGRIYLREVTPSRKKGSKKAPVSRVEARMLCGFHEEYRSGERDLGLPKIMRNPTVPAILEAAGYLNDEEEE